MGLNLGKTRNEIKHLFERVAAAPQPDQPKSVSGSWWSEVMSTSGAATLDHRSNTHSNVLGSRPALRYKSNTRSIERLFDISRGA
jgi:hypothetical protein